ncbi:MAG: hypothetical protein KF882_01220 [Bacteroidia bacterium]|nr:hypothetical protein [Bacteroidia bacterium]MCO5253287.1 hypothetical protein [Bacteroidota bacterium]
MTDVSNYSKVVGSFVILRYISLKRDTQDDRWGGFGRDTYGENETTWSSFDTSR